MGLPDYQMVVTDQHIQALEEAKVHFRYLTPTNSHEKKTPPVQS